MMGNKSRISCYSALFLASIALNIFLLGGEYSKNQKRNKLSWSEEAAIKAEEVAAVSCSGHGRAYLDGFVDDGSGLPLCECNTCYRGSDCSVFVSDCAADADSGDPLFLEPYWMQNAASSAVLVSGWHRMSYSFSDHSFISSRLETHIRRVHALAKNAVTKNKYILFGGGSTQLLGAAVYALSMNLSSPASVVAASPAYPLYKAQTDFFENGNFEYIGDVSMLKNSSDNTGSNVIEFVTSPNNPDGNLKKAISQGSVIYDHAYYWPHFTAIPAPADEDIMVFTLSKLTGHAGSRFGWAFVKEESVYKRMKNYIMLAEMGISREPQVRALKLMKSILKGNGTHIFEFAYEKMKDRWEKLNRIVSMSTRFTLQEIPTQYCNFFEKVRGPSPAYAWLKCEREEDTNCNSVLREGNIIGRDGSLFNVESRYVRLSMLKSDDDFNLLLKRVDDLVRTKDGVNVLIW